MEEPVATAPLKKEDFSADEIAVIRERHFGWECASYKLLAAVFNTTPRVIGKICGDNFSQATSGSGS